MSNRDLYQKALDAQDWKEAARLALQFAAGKGSRSGCWSWAEEAIASAAKAGITLAPGNLSWPDLEGMEKQLG